MALISGKNGAKVLVNGNNQESGKKVVEEIQSDEESAFFFRANVHVKEETKAMAIELATFKVNVNVFVTDLFKLLK